jgi:hypothetical protein
MTTATNEAFCEIACEEFTHTLKTGAPGLSALMVRALRHSFYIHLAARLQKKADREATK